MIGISFGRNFTCVPVGILNTSGEGVVQGSALGYSQRWAAHGGDWGAAVTTTPGHLCPPGLVGIHLTTAMFQPTPEEVAAATREEQKMLSDAQRYDQQYAGYMKLQGSRPQSVAFGLSDSPAGLAAWIYALFQDVSDSGGRPERVIALDHLIDDIMLYWITNAGPSSARFYWEAAQEMSRGMPAAPMPTSTGISMFPGEHIWMSKRWAQCRFAKLLFFREAMRGGHFAALENPDELVEHVRETFHQLH